MNPETQLRKLLDDFAAKLPATDYPDDLPGSDMDGFDHGLEIAQALLKDLLFRYDATQTLRQT